MSAIAILQALRAGMAVDRRLWTGQLLKRVDATPVQHGETWCVVNKATVGQLRAFAAGAGPSPQPIANDTLIVRKNDRMDHYFHRNDAG